MRDGSMFGALTKYKDQEFYEDHPEMWFCTPYANYKVELICGFVMDSEAEPFVGMEDTAFHTYLQEHQMQSTFESAEQIGDADRILILSTCSYEYLDARYVVIGALHQAQSEN